MKEKEMKLIADWIDQALRQRADVSAVTRIREEVFQLTSKFPIPE
jgi:glycine/serine hydroxymethyltransferase